MDQPDSPKSFREDPVAYCKELFSEYYRHADQQADDVAENFAFFYGKDELLERRRNEEGKSLAANYIPEIQPAIDTLNSAAMHAISTDPEPLKVYPKEEDAVDETQITGMRKRVNEELRSCGFMTGGVQQMMIGAANQPIVMAKMRWEKREGYYFEKKKISPFLATIAKLTGYQMPETMEEKYGVISEGVKFDILRWGEGLYDPTSPELADGRGMIHLSWMSRGELASSAADYGWDQRKIDEMIEQGPHGKQGDSKANDSSDPGRFEVNKFRIAEFYLPEYRKDRHEMRYFVLGNNNVALLQGQYGRRLRFGKINYPFLIHRVNQKFCEPEGIPWVRQVMDLARLLNDCFNMFCDAFSYGILPVTAIPKGKTFFEKQPEWHVGALWACDDPSAIKTIQQHLGDLAFLGRMIEMISAKIRQIINAPDIAQGIQGAPNELATKTLQRAQGTAIRSRGVFKPVGDLICNAAQMLIYMHQAVGDADWAGDYILDVPCLTAAFSADLERDLWLAILEMAKTNPVYQATPTGPLYIRAITEMIYQKYGLAKQVVNIIPSEEELEVANPLIVQVREAAVDLKAMKEQQSNPGPSPAEETDATAVFGGPEQVLN